VRRAAFVALVALGGLLPAAADLGHPPDVTYENLPYDGRFTFNRLRFTPAHWGPGNYVWGLDLKWNHDYPRADLHLEKILQATTSIDVAIEGSNILALDDPELFRHPVAYLCEPGFWALTDAEATGLREYLRKGGFVIVDDFRGRHWDAFVEGLRRVLPDARLVPLEAANPVFDAFFRVDPGTLGHPYGAPGPPAYYGVFEDNDPSRRLMLVANYNNDIAEYWEWSDTGFVPIDLSNEAYKLGVNYVVYGMTH
jgi:uncharacterized protein DUF4159